MKKGQAVNIDWTVGLSLFVITALTSVIFLTNANIGPDQISSLEAKNLDVQRNLEEEASIEARKIPLIVRGPSTISDIPVDRDYSFPSNAYPESGGGDIPVQLDISNDSIVGITESGNLTHSLVYFTEPVSKTSHSNDIETDNDWINNSKISMKISGTGINSLKINDNGLLNSDANLGSGDSSINESDLYAETLSNNLRVYNNSPELILDERTQNVTFNLKNLDTVYWYENDTNVPLTGTGVKAEGRTKGFTVASSYGITFMGDMEATVSKPDTSTVKAEIDAEKIRIRLHNSDYNTGKKRIKFYDRGYITLGASQKVSAPYESKIKQLNSVSEIEFENALNMETFSYNIGLGLWIQSLVDQLSDWNRGDFNATSASRKDNSGDLGLGYRNGTLGDSLVGYWRLEQGNLLENPGFENDEVGDSDPSSWDYPDSSGWNINDSYTAPESDGKKSFGGPWHDGPDVWPDAYVYNELTINGGESYLAESWVRLQSYSDANWNGGKSDQQYIYEDDARLHLYFYDNSGNLLKEEKTRWIGDAYNRGLNYIEKDGNWFKFTKAYTAPENAEYVRFQIDGGDNNNDYGDPETSHGGNAGIWIDDTSLTSRKISDYSGEGNTGVTQNKVVDTKGVFGTEASEFDGSNDQIKVSTSPSIEFGSSSFSISVWAKTADSSDYRQVLDKRSSSRNPDNVDDAGWFLRPVRANDGYAEFVISDGQDDTSSASATQNWADGKWHHYTAVRNAQNNVSLYVDGNLIDTSTSDVENVSNSPNDLFLGGKQKWNGSIDEIRIYENHLSSEEIKQLYKYGRDGTFNGEYTVENQTGSFQSWHELKVNANVPSDTSVESVFESLDEDGDVVDKQVIQIQSGETNHLINSDDSVGYRLTFKGTSSDPEKSWEINDYKIEYGPQLKRGTFVPLDTSAVVSDRSSALIHRNGTFSEIQNRVILWP